MTMLYKKPSQLLLPGILATTLVACGGGGGNEVATESPLNGIAISATNYQGVLQNGILGSAKAVTNLMYAGNEIDLSNLSTTASTSNSITYACDNNSGTLRRITLNSNTHQWVFNNCHITNSQPSTRYDGTMVTNTVMNSGTLSDVGDLSKDWDTSQVVTLTNFTQQSPINGGDRLTSNGIINVDTSNNLSLDLNRITLSSTSLIIDSINESSAQATSYAFSNLYYDLQEDIVDKSAQNDLDFTAKITDIGDLKLTTGPQLVYDRNELLQSGTVTATTGNSTARLVAIGNDSVEISLDSNNDGVYEITVPSNWSTLSQ